MEKPQINQNNVEVTFYQGAFPWNYIMSWGTISQGEIVNHLTITTNSLGNGFFQAHVRDDNGRLIFNKVYQDCDVSTIVNDFYSGEAALPKGDPVVEMIFAHRNGLQRHLYNMIGFVEKTYPDIVMSSLDAQDERLQGTILQKILGYTTRREQELSTLFPIVEKVRDISRSQSSNTDWGLVWNLDRKAEMELGCFTLDDAGAFVPSNAIVAESEKLQELWD